MIVQGAFWKLPELLLQVRPPPSEQTVATQFAMAALLELNARNIAEPLHRVVTEQPYGSRSSTSSNRRADVFLNLEGLYEHALGHYGYGMKPKNWVEVKYFRGSRHAAGVQPTTQNAGYVLLDLLRLCLLVREDQAKHRLVGRFGLVIFDERPSSYLAFGEQSARGSGRAWLAQLLEGGIHEVEVDLAREAGTIRQLFGGLRDALVGMRVETMGFQPTVEGKRPSYWGRLFRVVDFDVTVTGRTLSYRDGSEEVWSAEQVALQNELAELLLGPGDNA